MDLRVIPAIPFPQSSDNTTSRILNLIEFVFGCAWPVLVPQYERMVLRRLVTITNGNPWFPVCSDVDHSVFVTSNTPGLGKINPSFLIGTTVMPLEIFSWELITLSTSGAHSLECHR